MTGFEAIALLATMAALAALPSSSVALVIARSISMGTSHGIAVAAGIVLGDLVFIALVMLGLSVVAEAMGGAFVIIKILGALYLIWLGVSLLRSKHGGSLVVDADRQRGSYTASLLSGLLLTLGDVKAIFFYLSLLPVFVDLSSLQLADTSLVVVVTIVAVGGVKSLYALAASRFHAHFNDKPGAELTKRAAGAALIVAGGTIIVKP